MIAIKIEPFGSPHLIQIDAKNIEDELHQMQMHIGGYIETVRLQDGTLMLVDEDGVHKYKSKNNIASALSGRWICGTVLIVGVDEDVDEPVLTNVPCKYYKLLAFNMI